MGLSWDFMGSDGIYNHQQWGYDTVSHGCILLAQMISEKKGRLARSIFGGHEFIGCQAVRGFFRAYLFGCGHGKIPHRTGVQYGFSI